MTKTNVGDEHMTVTLLNFYTVVWHAQIKALFL